jgi:hypothetical protein
MLRKYAMLRVSDKRTRPTPAGELLPAPLGLLRLRGAGSHDGRRKKKKRIEARLAGRQALVQAREAEVIRAKRAKEKAAFRARAAVDTDACMSIECVQSFLDYGQKQNTLMRACVSACTPTNGAAHPTAHPPQARRKERELIDQEDKVSSEDDGAGLRYAMALPEETRQSILDQLRALEPPLPDDEDMAGQQVGIGVGPELMLCCE